MVTRGRGSTGRYLTSRGRTSADAGRDTPGTQYHGKRILDLATLSLLAIPAVVLGAICALAIWLEDGPPVFFRQVRAG